MTTPDERPTVAITMGDINGIGPETLARALARKEILAHCNPVVIGNAEILAKASKLVNAPDVTRFIDPESEPAPDCTPGLVSAEAGRAAVQWIERAAQKVIEGGADALVTCPISKEAIHQAGSQFKGHTDMLAHMTGASDYRMCLFSDRMRIVHITGHRSLRDALDAITQERIMSSIRIGHSALVNLGLPKRRIAVAGLNPHAGEAGAFGREELEIVIPAIARCASEGIECSGPYAPDTVFRRMYDGEFDMTIALYHDQGHIALKMIAMDKGVNVTLGLPIIRTSPDHGTAFDIAWQGIARENSLCEAIKLAAHFTHISRRVEAGGPTA